MRLAGRRWSWLPRGTRLQLMRVLVVALVVVNWSIGCESVPVLVAPDRCEDLTYAQLDDLEAMVIAGDYPGVEEIVSAYEHHCCVDDMISGRGSEFCTSVPGHP